jgi:hypothetical protein
MLLLLAAVDRLHSYDFKRFHSLCVFEQYFQELVTREIYNRADSEAKSFLE